MSYSSDYSEIPITGAITTTYSLPSLIISLTAVPPTTSYFTGAITTTLSLPSLINSLTAVPPTLSYSTETMSSSSGSVTLVTVVSTITASKAPVIVSLTQTISVLTTNGSTESILETLTPATGSSDTTSAATQAPTTTQGATASATTSTGPALSPTQSVPSNATAVQSPSNHKTTGIAIGVAIPLAIIMIAVTVWFILKARKKPNNDTSGSAILRWLSQTGKRTSDSRQGTKPRDMVQPFTELPTHPPPVPPPPQHSLPSIPLSSPLWSTTYTGPTISPRTPQFPPIPERSPLRPFHYPAPTMAEQLPSPSDSVQDALRTPPPGSYLGSGDDDIPFDGTGSRGTRELASFYGPRPESSISNVPSQVHGGTLTSRTPPPGRLLERRQLTPDPLRIVKRNNSEVSKMLRQADRHDIPRSAVSDPAERTGPFAAGNMNSWAFVTKEGKKTPGLDLMVDKSAIDEEHEEHIDEAEKEKQRQDTYNYLEGLPSNYRASSVYSRDPWGNLTPPMQAQETAHQRRDRIARERQAARRTERNQENIGKTNDVNKAPGNWI